LAERVRAARRKKYLLTVTRSWPGCTCAGAPAADRPCAQCSARLARGYPKHDIQFVVLGEEEFEGLRQTASREEIDRLGALGLVPVTRREVAHYGQCCPEKPRAAMTGAHVHALCFLDAVAHDEDVDVRGCPDGGQCGGLHLRGLRWYDGALCRFEVLDGPGAEDDALRAVVDGEDLPAGSGAPAPVPATGSAGHLRPGEACQFCYGEHPEHELADCPGNHEVEERLI
jgi:hypothetical protein